jgi:hypothetical protein
MWLVIIIALSLVMGVLALIGLLAVARELFSENSPDANFTDTARTTDRHDAGGAYGDAA